MNIISSNSNNHQYVVDLREVDRQIDELYVSAGYTKTKSSGEVVRDEEKVKSSVFDLVKGKKVPDKNQRSKYSWTQDELYAAVFPGAPGTDGKDPENLEPNEREVRAKLRRKVWSLTNPGVQGFVQKRLGAEGTLVLCRGSVMRGLNELPGIYVTDDPDIIMADSVHPEVEALVSKANNLRKHIEMIGARHPELESRVAAALGTGIDRTRAALPMPNAKGGGATAKSSAASSAETPGT